jgi:hypothetical protein
MNCGVLARARGVIVMVFKFQVQTRGDAMKRFGMLMVLLALCFLESAMGFAGRSSNAGEVRFESPGEVSKLVEIPLASMRLERFRGRKVHIWKVSSSTRFVTLDDDARTDLEFWKLEAGRWQVTRQETLIEHKDQYADQHPDFAGTVPELVQIGPRDFAVGVLTIRRTGYSGGGGANTYLNLYNLSKPGAILRDSLVASSKTIRACFSEADYNSGRPCTDEYNASSTLKFFGMRNGMFRLKKHFEVKMQPAFRKPSDPSGDTSQADRIAVCAPYNLEYEWNPQKLEFVSLWPEPDSCAL